MKTHHRKNNSNVRTLNSVQNPFERITGFFRLNNFLTFKAKTFNYLLQESSLTKEEEMLKIEAEIKRNQARNYANIVPPK
jgi:hypothetical protein